MNKVILNLINSKVFDINDTYSLVQVNKYFSNNKLLNYHNNLVLVNKINKFKIIQCTFSEWVSQAQRACNLAQAVGITDKDVQAHEYSMEYYSEFFSKPFNNITDNEVALLNSYIWLNTNVRNAKQFMGETSKYFRIHPNGLIFQIPNLQNYVSGNGPFINIKYRFSRTEKENYVYLPKDELYVNLVVEIEPDNTEITISKDKLERIMKSIILQDSDLSFDKRVSNLDLFIEY
jgi:hypothetical protein